VLNRISIKAEDSMTRNAVPSDDLGIVVIGRNEGARLLRGLNSLITSGRDVIYVDSGSTDGSADKAENIGAAVVRLNPSVPFTAARARNEGFAALRASRTNFRFVQFVDGDCQLVDGWLEQSIAFMKQQDKVGVVCGRRRELFPEISIYNYLCDIEWNTSPGEATACGGDALMRVEAFEEAGGFRPQLIAGEEPDLCARVLETGWKIWRLDADMTVHDAAMVHFKQWWIRAVRSGYGSVEVCALNRDSKVKPFLRNVMSATFWGGLLPVTILMAGIIEPVFSLAAFVYPMQLIRVALKSKPRNPKSWIYALFMLMGKFAEFQGIIKFCWHSSRGQVSPIIEYKRPKGLWPH
jgi:glycosyltransferase involved in cell wall biosynthesis